MSPAAFWLVWLQECHILHVVTFTAGSKEARSGRFVSGFLLLPAKSISPSAVRYDLWAGAEAWPSMTVRLGRGFVSGPSGLVPGVWQFFQNKVSKKGARGRWFSCYHAGRAFFRPTWKASHDGMAIASEGLNISLVTVRVQGPHSKCLITLYWNVPFCHQ